MNSEPAFLQSGAAGRPAPGELESGDLCLVKPLWDGAMLAVIDGLGHGPEAASAAFKARDSVRECAGEPLEVIFDHCHKALKGTRGAVMTLVRINAAQETLTWMGVGNVEGRIWRASPEDSLIRQAPPLRGGVVGHALPRFRPSTLPLLRGDLIILSTDGLSTIFHEEFRLRGTVQQIADNILQTHWTAKDDGLVLVVRYLGPR